jgi:excisionase family DNA binding protein
VETNKDMDSIVVISQEALSQLIEEAVRKSLPKQAPQPKSEPNKVTRELALSFLEDKGYTVSKSLFYKATSAREIPFTRFGRRLLFNKTDLLSWAENRCTSHNTRKHDAAIILMNSANKKRR